MLGSVESSAPSFNIRSSLTSFINGMISAGLPEKTAERSITKTNYKRLFSRLRMIFSISIQKVPMKVVMRINPHWEALSEVVLKSIWSQGAIVTSITKARAARVQRIMKGLLKNPMRLNGWRSERIFIARSTCPISQAVKATV